MTRKSDQKLRARVLVCLAGLSLMAASCASAPTQRVLAPDAPSSSAPMAGLFRNVWVAGFVAATRADVDVNALLVQRLRDELASVTSARVLPAPPIRLKDEPELLTRAEFANVVREYADALVITGTADFDYPARPRHVGGPGRNADVHTQVTLRLRLAFIDGATGRVMATTSYPPVAVGVAHGLPTLRDAFERLFHRNAEAVMRDIALGTGD